MISVLSKQSTVRANRFVFASLADQFQRSTVFKTLSLLFFVLLPLVIRQSFELFDNTDNFLIFRDVVCNALPNYCLFFALRTDKHFPVTFDRQFEYDTFLAESVTASGHNPRYSVVEIVLLMASFTVWSYLFGC